MRITSAWRSVLLALPFLLPAASVLAEHEDAVPPPAAAPEETEAHRMPLGSRTRAWLDRQKSGDVASEEAAGLTPPADRRARMRYLRSFEYPLPELFEMDETEGN
jgi:hypothetical protein